MTSSREEAGGAPADATAPRPRAPRRAPAARPPRRATLRDVADLAGVSVATVSRVLADNYPVSVSTRNKVMRAVRRLDYVVNAHARALQVGASRTIAFVLDDITGPSFAQAAAGVEEEAAECGRICVVCTTGGDSERQAAVIDLMRTQGTEAVILIGGTTDDDAAQERLASYARALAASGSRLVLCGHPPLREEAPVTVVDYDNEAGAYAATAHVLSQGHRRVAFLGGRAGHLTASARLAGYLRALTSFGVDPDPALQIPGDLSFSRESGVRSLRRALDEGVRFTAVVAATDMVAAGALSVLRDRGVRVPEDVSLVGYDDIPLTVDLTPRLTTVHVPYRELGRTAVRHALRPRTGPQDEPDHVVLGTHLVVRDSVAPPGA
ncbi:LacI family DNA-binding transcriptional regulator [Streptomyces sp. NPDC050560]|uniref:LacI family DNA-binding transcriptional regulator n=1 Tax=Streptomyces sp. NPDC050560 TaxID=3365630 RepID=UPI0037907DCA